MRISPRQLAVAIGVSESSLKRWADAGKLAVSRTEGGHRRIAVTEAVRFIRDSGATVVRPDLLGLDDGGRGKRRRGPESAFVAALLAGDARTARASLIGRFLAGESIAALADGDIADALAQIEALHERSLHDVKSELAARRATDALTHAIAALRGLCEIGDGARVAVGGGRVTGDGGRRTGDGGRVTGRRSAVVAAVLAGEGLRVIDLGAGITTAVLRAATAAHAPAITWIIDDVNIDLGGYRVRSMSEVAAYARGLSAR